MNYHFDRLDDETFQQVLLRCRASDFPSLDRVSHRFQTTIRSETFIRLRIATEWAEARAVIWSAERLERSQYTGLYPPRFEIDLVVDEQVAGNAKFYWVARRPDLFEEMCEMTDVLEDLQGHIFDLDGKSFVRCPKSVLQSAKTDVN